jgi:5'-nucleotidase
MTMQPPKNYLIDMDGVLISGQAMIPDADRFLARLRARGAKHVVLTNNSRYTPGDLAHRLQAIGLDIPAELIFTSAMATARFMQAQHATGTAYVVGESGLTEAIHQAGYVITDHDPDYVVLGEAPHYTMEALTTATRLVMAGAHFVCTNSDPSGPGEGGLVPACGAVAALIERASGISPFFVGKPNPLMMRTALNYLGVHSENTVMVGDRMDTDIVAGVESGMETILVLSGVTDRSGLARYPYQPTRIVKTVAEIEV